MNDSVLGVVPARGGSKRVPRKNLAEVAGKPMVARAVEQAESADALDEVVVSTDDDEIRRVSREHGGYAPFERPEELATDTASSADVLDHALSWYETERDETFDVVAMIQVTTPLRTPADVDGALERLRETDADSDATVTKYHTPPVWAVYEADDRLRQFFDGDYLWTDDEVPRSQDLPTLYYPNGG